MIAIIHICPPQHVHTSACGWTDARNNTQERAAAALREKFDVEPSQMSPEQFAVAVAAGWCGNCLNVCFGVGDWVPWRQTCLESDAHYGEYVNAELGRHHDQLDALEDAADEPEPENDYDDGQAKLF